MKLIRKSIYLIIAFVLVFIACGNPYEVEIPHWDYEDEVTEDDGTDESGKEYPVVYPTAGAAKVKTLQTTGLFRETKISDGIVHYAFAGKDELSNAYQNVNVLEIDLNNEANIINFYYSSSSDVVSSVAKKNNAIAAVNATYEQEAVYCRTNGYNHSEVTLTPGHERFWKHNAALVGDGARKIGIVNGAPGEETTDKGGEMAIAMYKSLKEKNIFGSAPMLIDDYKPVGEKFVPSFYTESDLGKLNYEDYRRHQGVRHPRTAVALTDDNDLLLIVVDGRFSGKAEGMSAKELTQFIAKHFNPRWAINMDGGGSSTMYIKGYGDPENNVLNYPTDNDKWDHQGERSLRTHLLVLSAKK